VITAQVINGIVVGLGYSLVAMGWTLVFGVLRKLSMAHGQMFMGAALTAWVCWTTLAHGAQGSHVGVGTVVLSGIVAIGAGAAAGLIVYLLGFRVIRTGGDLPPIATTLSIASVAGAIAVAVFGSEPKQVPGTNIGGVLHILGAPVARIQVVIAAVALVIALGLLVLVNKSPWGKRVRAVSESAASARRAGIRVEVTVAEVFLLSGAIAGVGAFLFMIRTGSVSPQIGDDFLIQGLVVMVVGGLGRVSGALAAGIFVGIVQGLAVALFPGQYSQLIAWSLIVVLLTVRPRGILGTATA
jgi:branched-chain amino acid transport system permease protein